MIKFGNSFSVNLIMSAIRRQGFKTPSAIQRQAWPCALAGRDMIGISRTGSGKTIKTKVLSEKFGRFSEQYNFREVLVAFLLPAMLQIASQEAVQRGQGPIRSFCFNLRLPRRVPQLMSVHISSEQQHEIGSCCVWHQQENWPARSRKKS